MKNYLKRPLVNRQNKGLTDSTVEAKCSSGSAILLTCIKRLSDLKIYFWVFLLSDQIRFLLIMDIFSNKTLYPKLIKFFIMRSYFTKLPYLFVTL